MNKLQQKRLLSSLIIFLIFKLCNSVNTITPSQPLKDDDNNFIISTNQIFALGFFTPGVSPHRFIGIWYNKIPEKTVVWVLNRDNPINGTHGILTVDDRDGNLVLYENNQTRVPTWSSNVNASSTEAQLLDSGNFVLVDRENGSNTVWESFDFPTDTTIPTMKLGLNRKTGKNWFLTSWKSRDDPSSGNIFLKINPIGFPQVFLYNGSVPLWRSGPWTGQRWSGVPEMSRTGIFNPSFVNNKDEVSITYTFANSIEASVIITKKTVNESGMLQQTAWTDPNWIELWSGPKDPCDKFGKCGPNSNCEQYDSVNSKCKCLPGFEPKSAENGSDGCIRKSGALTCQSGEGFIRLTGVILPDTSIARADMNMKLKACEKECLKNCSCTAYSSAYEDGIGCLNWFGDLIDTKNLSNVGQDLYIRVDETELGIIKSKGALNGRLQAVIIVCVVVLPFLSTFGIYCLVKKRRKARDKRRRSKYLLSFISQDSENGKGNDDEGGISDLPFFNLSFIAEATNNFSDDKKLGKGGFGPVYKGVLPGGKEIAVKRLSKYSGQGNDEFKNEVALIAKLQHRNLVKMLGYCIQDHEKMLIYEFLPNKSLDTFIFDEEKRKLLNWSIRYEIICGIARGILYLHQDSRLRIIHRDLKASNVLLDASMKPKISDFGMARIFEANQIEAETHRVVGTYGYMAPEYAMQGQFSVKSDVYSFGILLLEIISGRKNSSFYNEIKYSNLGGHVWELWKEGRAKEIVDESVGTESKQQEEIERCIQIGLLCVQESAMDRPTMSSVVHMLSNDTVLASPKQPAFILKTTYSNIHIQDPSTSTTTSGGTSSINSMSETVLLPR
ncbi:G-type lectin S-receptor-like serine/threonine-protein kinase RKS1 [Euphorbia peplus]|nr:G-type lectin S-receptor-like serine/threonine-protein kinase RKS1 [Euphorbia peplus]